MKARFSHSQQFIETVCANCKQLTYLSDMVNHNTQGYLICDECFKKLTKEKRNEKKRRKK